MEKFAAFKFMPPIPLGKDGARVSDCEAPVKRTLSTYLKLV